MLGLLDKSVRRRIICRSIDWSTPRSQRNATASPVTPYSKRGARPPLSPFQAMLGRLVMAGGIGGLLERPDLAARSPMEGWGS
jgi:hypothetical protein